MIQDQGGVDKGEGPRNKVGELGWGRPSAARVRDAMLCMSYVEQQANHGCISKGPRGDWCLS